MSEDEVAYLEEEWGMQVFGEEMWCIESLSDAVERVFRVSEDGETVDRRE